MTFQAWKTVLLNSMTFQEEWSPRYIPLQCSLHCHSNQYIFNNNIYMVFESKPLVGKPSK